jgi:L-amino acid N-acyltransferase YncA
VDVSIALISEQRAKGRGTALLRQACRKFWEHFPAMPLAALILDNNVTSQRIFRKVGFKQTGEMYVDDRRFLLYSVQPFEDMP